MASGLVSRFRRRCRPSERDVARFHGDEGIQDTAKIAGRNALQGPVEREVEDRVEDETLAEVSIETDACHRGKGAGVSASTAWSCATTAAPSPIAPPTRFADPERTSPTANTPRILDSSGSSRGL
jgi:hypothetical protein